MATLIVIGFSLFLFASGWAVGFYKGYEWGFKSGIKWVLTHEDEIEETVDRIFRENK